MLAHAGHDVAGWVVAMAWGYHALVPVLAMAGPHYVLLLWTLAGDDLVKSTSHNAWEGMVCITPDGKVGGMILPMTAQRSVIISTLANDPACCFVSLLGDPACFWYYRSSGAAQCWWKMLSQPTTPQHLHFFDAQSQHRHSRRRFASSPRAPSPRVLRALRVPWGLVQHASLVSFEVVVLLILGTGYISGPRLHGLVVKQWWSY